MQVSEAEASPCGREPHLASRLRASAPRRRSASTAARRSSPPSSCSSTLGRLLCTRLARAGVPFMSSSQAGGVARALRVAASPTGGRGASPPGRGDFIGGSRGGLTKPCNPCPCRTAQSSFMFPPKTALHPSWASLLRSRGSLWGYAAAIKTIARPALATHLASAAVIQ